MRKSTDVVDDQIAAGIARNSDAANRQAVSDITNAFVSTVTIPTAAGMSFADLAEGADVVHGHSLEKDKGSLLGVPFVITSVTFRDGAMKGDKRSPTPTNYLSVEAVTADHATLQRLVTSRRITPEVASRFLPNEPIVFNDGSTGIARQLTAYLHSQGLIQVPEGPEVGGMGESRYDAYRASWVKGYNPDQPNPRFDIRLVAMRGLRVSTYETPMSPDDADTYYLA